MNTNTKKEKIVYSLRIATELIRRGHKVITTIPNPEEPRYTTWIFEVDDTLELDFEEIKGGIRNGK